MTNSNSPPELSGDQEGAPADEAVEERAEISFAKLRVSRKESESLMSSGDSR